VQVLDRVLDRDHVPARLDDAMVQHRGDGGRLSGAGRADQKDQPLALEHHAPQDRRQLERFEGRHLGLHAPQHRARDAHRAIAVHAEAAQDRVHVRQVRLAALGEGGPLPDRQEPFENGLHRVRVEQILSRDRRDEPVHLDRRGHALQEVDVRRPI
jgi:hypothetical protein